MAYYNRDDLASVLKYLADEFGAGVFTGHGRGTGREDIINLLPYFFSTALHKGEYHLMEIMAREGVMKTLESLKHSDIQGADSRRKLHKLHMEILKLTEYFIPEDTAAKYVYMVAEAMGLEVPAIEPVKVEPVKVEPVKVEPVKVEPVKVEPAEVEPAEVEPAETADTLTNQTKEIPAPKLETVTNPSILDEQKAANKFKYVIVKEFFRLCVTGDAAVVEKELTKGMTANTRGSFERTALHVAVLKGRTDIVKILLEHGADVNVHDVHGKTPLHFAARKGREEVIKILLSHGADASAADNYGLTAFDEAIKGHHRDIAELLRV